MQGISQLAEEGLPSQGLCSMLFIS